MLRTLRNFAVSIMAAFIRDKQERHKFRNKYKIKSKFRKLRDDNRQMFNDIRILIDGMNKLNRELSELKDKYNKHLYEWEVNKYRTFLAAPLDNSPPKGPDTEVFLAIVVVAKNEGPYIKEWIEYHKIVGVDRIYFYDNESDDNTKEILEPYIKDGTVVYHFLPNHPITKRRQQIEAYNDAIFKYRDRVKWMAIIDADEFIVPVEKNSIPEFLADYDQYIGIVVNWVCFDSNGHDKKPMEHGGLLTANYTRVRKDHNKGLDRIVKSIVNPKMVVSCTSAHDCIYYLSQSAVTENLERFRGQSTRVHSSNKIRINHYSVKSREEYVNKIKRNGKGSENAYKFTEEKLNFPDETTEDLVIQKYLPRLYQALGINK